MQDNNGNTVASIMGIDLDTLQGREEIPSPAM